MVTHQTQTTQSTNYNPSKLRLYVTAGLFAALTFVSTFVIKIPVFATKGYIHPGDGFVLLSGIFLGPLWGGLAAGFGSMLSDLIGGYLTYVPATFVIKALVAVIASGIVTFLQKLIQNRKNVVPVIIGGVAGESFMVIGYFIYETFMYAFSASGGLSATSFTAGITSSALGIPANIVQGVSGIVISAILYPILRPVIKRQAAV